MERRGHCHGCGGSLQSQDHLFHLCILLLHLSQGRFQSIYLTPLSVNFHLQLLILRTQISTTFNRRHGRSWWWNSTAIASTAIRNGGVCVCNCNCWGAFLRLRLRRVSVSVVVSWGSDGMLFKCVVVWRPLKIKQLNHYGKKNNHIFLIEFFLSINR